MPSVLFSSIFPSSCSAKTLTRCNPIVSVCSISKSSGIPTPSSLTVNSRSPSLVDCRTMVISPSPCWGNACFKELETSSLIINPQEIAFSRSNATSMISIFSFIEHNAEIYPPQEDWAKRPFMDGHYLKVSLNRQIITRLVCKTT